MPKLIDLTGKTFGELTVLSRMENLILKSGKPRTKWLCKCSCGKETIVSSQSLTQGTTVSCGCVAKQKRREGKMKVDDLTGQRFGRLTVLNRCDILVYESGATKTKWHCRCDCGKEVDVFRTGLLSGKTKSCGCYRSERTHERVMKDLRDKTFGKLTAIEIICRHRTQNIWRCQCACGNVCKVPTGHLLSGHTTSCGCDKTSRGEAATVEILEENFIKFKREYSFEDLRSARGGRLRFDFAIFDGDILKCLVEYQGPQHYKEVRWHNFGSMQREETDELKRMYCRDHGIKLYEIRYDENVEYRLMEIIIDNFAIYENSVPSLA